MVRKPNGPLLGLPKKTLHSLFFIALIGGSALLLRSRLAPVETGDDGAAGKVWSDPMAASAEAVDDTDAAGDLSALSTQGAGRPAKHARQPIEDPSGCMCPFYAALRKLDNDTAPEGKVRILHFGDSILTTDQLSGTIRRKLQARFGEGGHGFVLLGRPWRWYHHLDVVQGADDKWRPRPLTSDPTRDGLLGLGAVAFETNERGATAWAGTVDDGAFGRSVATFDVSYLAQPRGGTLNLLVDGVLKERLSTAADEKQVMHRLVRVPTGPSKLTVKTEGDGIVRIFGAVLENERPGIVYDSLAINGARISNFERLDEAHFAEELRHRRANMVVMMCGANEGNNDALALSAYKDQLATVLRRVRTALPEAACLVMGPLDQATTTANGGLESRKMPKKLTKAQRETATAEGCAFFDTFAAMGGTGSMPKWVRRGLVGGDFIHPTETGARMIGNWLTEAILAGYENFVLNGESCESNVTSL